MSFFLMIGSSDDSILDDHHSFIEFLHAVHDPPSLLSSRIDPDASQECEVVFELIAEGGVLVVHLHASQFRLLYLLL